MAKCSAYGEMEGNCYLSVLNPAFSINISYKNLMLLSAACFLISLRLPFKSSLFTHVLLPSKGEVSRLHYSQVPSIKKVAGFKGLRGRT